MANATFRGSLPLARQIRGMDAGDVGFTVPWAFDPKTGDLAERYSLLGEPGGTAQLRVDCVMPGVYRVALTAGAQYEYILDPMPANLA